MFQSDKQADDESSRMWHLQSSRPAQTMKAEQQSKGGFRRGLAVDRKMTRVFQSEKRDHSSRLGRIHIAPSLPESS